MFDFCPDFLLGTDCFLAFGLSVAQSMLVIIVGRALICFFAILIAWCGLRWHIGFTVQNRFTWGFRGSYIALLQRILLNFIWCSVQCEPPFSLTKAFANFWQAGMAVDLLRKSIERVEVQH